MHIKNSILINVQSCVCICVLISFLPLQSLLCCYKTEWDLKHVDMTDRLPSRPMNLQNHNCPLSGILKAHTETKKVSLISSYHQSLFFFFYLIFSCTLLLFLLLSACESKHFLNSNSTELSLVSLSKSHISPYASRQFKPIKHYPLTHIPS